MTDVKAQEGRIKAVALVRNMNGDPQFNDFNNIPEVFHGALSVEDWEYIEHQRGLQHGNNSRDS